MNLDLHPSARCSHPFSVQLLTENLLSWVFSEVKRKLVEVFEFAAIFELLFKSWQKGLQLLQVVTSTEKPFSQ